MVLFRVILCVNVRLTTSDEPDLGFRLAYWRLLDGPGTALTPAVRILSILSAY